MRWAFLVVFVWVVGGLSLWWMFRPPKVDDADAEAKRERRRQIERQRMAKWEAADADRRAARRRRRQHLDERFKRDSDKET
jgi:hypothetical protein